MDLLLTRDLWSQVPGSFYLRNSGGTLVRSSGRVVDNYKGDLTMDRIVELGKKIWSLLTEEEQERYFFVGTLTFVEDIAVMVGYDLDSDDTSIDDIHYQIFGY